MAQKSSNVILSKSPITYSYATIKITQSRIDKGLIAVPVSLVEWFPHQNADIEVYLDDSPSSQTKHYSSYRSSTHECRIGGVRQWFQNNNIESGDEIVIHLIDKERFIYRLIPERNYISKTQELQRSFDSSETEQEATGKIATLAKWTHLERSRVVLNEYRRLINTLPSQERLHIERSSGLARESVPASLRTLLEHIYGGHCQVCDFSFLKRDRRPYFEIHHLDPLKGHHPQNVLVVCGNCHNQFEYSAVKKKFNDEDWLINVCFNERVYSVKQAVLSMRIELFYKELFI